MRKGVILVKLFTVMNLFIKLMPFFLSGLFIGISVMLSVTLIFIQREEYTGDRRSMETRIKLTRSLIHFSILPLLLLSVASMFISFDTVQLLYITCIAVAIPIFSLILFRGRTIKLHELRKIMVGVFFKKS